MRALPADPRILFVRFLDLLAFFDRLTVVDERANGDETREFRHPSVVIVVEVRDHQVVDLGDAGVARDRHDPFGVASVRAAPARVDQERLPRRRDDERRLAALDVDEVDVEGLRGLGHGGLRRQESRQYERGSHHRSPSCRVWSANHTPVYPVSDRAPHHAHRARWPCNRVRRRAHWLRRRTGPLRPVRPVGACPGRDRTAAALRCQRRDLAERRWPRRRAAGHRSRRSARSREFEAVVRHRLRRAARGGRGTHGNHHLRRPGQPARLGRPGVRAA